LKEGLYNNKIEKENKMSEQNRNDELVANITDNIRKITNVNHLRTIQKEIKEQRSYIGRKIGNQLQRGDKVRVNSGTGIEHGEVIKVNRTRAVVNIDNRNWNVPFSMITKEVDNV
jgi:preprotein translocase subunit YajC